jgi:penicillin-binding protein 1A
LPAQAWHAFMSVVHTNRNIPTIPGLLPHPAQVAEQQRLVELKRTDPGLAQAQIVHATQKRSSIMADQTRDILRRLAETMRRSGGQQVAPANEPAPAAAPKARDQKSAPPGAKPGERRADGSDASGRTRP